MSVPSAMDPPPVPAPVTVPRSIIHRPESVQDWGNQKANNLPKSNELNDTRKITEEELSVPFAMSPPPVSAPLAVSHPIIHRPQSFQDWENQKARITNLYLSNELKDTMKIMEEQHGFKATYAAMSSNSFDSTQI